jgi:hypothetical protein
MPSQKSCFLCVHVSCRAWWPIDFVRNAEVKLRPDERLPLSTEILESSFGERPVNRMVQFTFALAC